MNNKRSAIKEWLEITAIVLAAIWALYTFYWDKIAAPSKEPTFLTLNSTITKISTKENFDVYQINISSANSSKSRELVLASWFDLQGYNYILDNRDVDSLFANDIVSNGDQFNRFPRYFYDNDSTRKIIHYGRILPINTWLNPEQELSTQFITLVPKGKFEAMRLTLHSISSKEDNNLKVEWSVESDGYTYPKFIRPIASDTIQIDNIDKMSTLNVQDLFGGDYSYTSNENEYALPTLFHQNTSFRLHKAELDRVKSK